jgi:hypothetical protein
MYVRMLNTRYPRLHPLAQTRPPTEPRILHNQPVKRVLPPLLVITRIPVIHTCTLTHARILTHASQWRENEKGRTDRSCSTSGRFPDCA